MVPNPGHETRITITRTWHMQNKNSTRFYCKEETKQGYDNKTYPKLVLNILKIMTLQSKVSLYTKWFH